MVTDELNMTHVKEVACQHFKQPVEVERTKTGLSTYVYRVSCEGQTFYLRVLPEDASFAVEAAAHEIMLANGIAVPKPLCYEHKNALLGKSIMLTSEIPGECIDKNGSYIPVVLFAAGRQLAVINSIPVDGFSWIDRTHYDVLKGVKRTFREYYYETLYADIEHLREYGFDTDAIKKLVDEAYPLLETDKAFLMHGDFDDSHIFQQQGRYTGIIDFGEIRGSHRLYDLGHYKLHDSCGRFSSLLAGYRTVCPISDEDLVKIDYLALFMGLGRCKYRHYKTLIQRQLEEMRKEHIL